MSPWHCWVKWGLLSKRVSSFEGFSPMALSVVYVASPTARTVLFEEWPSVLEGRPFKGRTEYHLLDRLMSNRTGTNPQSLCLPYSARSCVTPRGTPFPRCGADLYHWQGDRASDQEVSAVSSGGHCPRGISRGHTQLLPAAITVGGQTSSPWWSPVPVEGLSLAGQAARGAGDIRHRVWVADNQRWTFGV